MVIYWGRQEWWQEAIIISITGGFVQDCSRPLSTGGGKFNGCHHGMTCKPCRHVLRDAISFICEPLFLRVMTGLQPLRHFQRISGHTTLPSLFHNCRQVLP
nr:hypothetical protein [Escherichia coli]